MHKQTLFAGHQTLTPYVTNHSELNWQCEEDLPQRREMIIKIHELLKQGQSNASKKWLNQLPQVANYLEQQLYQQASSLEEYRNGHTIVHRLNLMKESCMPPNSLWQSDTHVPQRRKMIITIINLLKENGIIDGDNLDEKKIAQMANHLEQLVYQNAASFKEYNDSTTLMNRINYVSAMNKRVIMRQNNTKRGIESSPEQEYVKVETDDDDP